MPRPGQYTPTRRVVMQVVIWMVLGATIGFAALVDHYRATPTRLGARLINDGLSLRLPEDWEVAKPKVPIGAHAQLIFSAREQESLGRSLSVTAGSLPADTTISAADYLMAALGSEPTQTDRFTNRRAMRFGQNPGEQVTLQRKMSIDDTTIDTYLICGATILPDHRAITLVLEGVGKPSSADKLLFQNVADSIQAAPGK